VGPPRTVTGFDLFLLIVDISYVVLYVRQGDYGISSQRASVASYC
jgi:hypothetical protein